LKQVIMAGVEVEFELSWVDDLVVRVLIFIIYICRIWLILDSKHRIFGI